jgi:circadian clock protein KaiC
MRGRGGVKSSFARRLLHIGQLGFFDEPIIPDRLYYISPFRVFEQEGLPALLHLPRREVQVRAAIFPVRDGLSVVEETAASAREFKKFIHDLQAQAAIADRTMLLLTGVPQISAERTPVDGVIELQTKLYGRVLSVSRTSISCTAAMR